MKRFLDLADFTRDEVLALLELARRLERTPEPRALTGKLLGLLFFNPSLRTLASFQAAMARLGGQSLVINPGQGSWQMETRRGVIMDGAAAEHVHRDCLRVEFERHGCARFHHRPCACRQGLASAARHFDGAVVAHRGADDDDVAIDRRR